MSRSRPAARGRGRPFPALLLALVLFAALLAACGSRGPTPVPVTAGPTPAASSAASSSPAGPTADPAIVAAMPPADALDDRWGTYVSEREWGNPRQSQGGNGWGMSPLEATRVDYTYAEDGIAAISRRRGRVPRRLVVLGRQERPRHRAPVRPVEQPGRQRRDDHRPAHVRRQHAHPQLRRLPPAAAEALARHPAARAPRRTLRPPGTCASRTRRWTTARGCCAPR